MKPLLRNVYTLYIRYCTRSNPKFLLAMKASSFPKNVGFSLNQLKPFSLAASFVYRSCGTSKIQYYTCVKGKLRKVAFTDRQMKTR